MKKESYERVKTLLSNNSLLQGLEDFYLDDLLKVSEVRTWSKGSQIICEGEVGDAVYFLLSGKAKVCLYGEGGREIVLSILEEGDMFGEMAILDDKPRSANVEATKDVECLYVSKDAFLNYLGTHHKVYIRFLGYLTARLREATRKIGGLALLDVCGRIAHTFMGMVKEEGTASTQRVVAIERPTHEEIAAMIGSSREVVSRALKKMSQEGYIKIEKDRILLYLS